MLYDELNEFVYRFGLDKAIELIRQAKISNENSLSTEVFIDNDFYVKSLLQIVSEEYALSKDDLLNSTNREVTEARKICYSIMKHDLAMQLSEIAFLFNKHDSTICRALSSLIKSILKKSVAKRKYDSIRTQIIDLKAKHNEKRAGNNQQFETPRIELKSIVLGIKNDWLIFFKKNKNNKEY